MKNIFLVALGLVLMGAGCFASTELPTAPAEDPQSIDEHPYGGDDSSIDDRSYGNDGLGDEVTLSGVVITDAYVQTLMECIFPDSAQPGDRMKCNNGWTNMGFIDDQGREIWLHGYSCGIEEFDVHEGETEYELDCTNDVQIGEVYTFYGSLGWRVDSEILVFRDGAWFMTDVTLVK